MRLKRILTLVILLILPCQQGHSQSTETNPTGMGTGIFVGQDMMLTAAPAYQLTFRADVQQFDYQPGGDFIAYVSKSTESDGTNTTVNLIGTRENGDTPRSLYSGYDIDLLGWDSGGRYLLVRENSKNYHICDVGTVPFSTQLIRLPWTAPDDVQYEMAEFAWSPQRTHILFAQYAEMSTNQRYHALSPTPPVYTVYDPRNGKSEIIAPSEGFEVAGWLDEGNLLLEKRPSGDTRPTGYDSYDPATGKAAVLPMPLSPALKHDLLRYTGSTASLVSPINPDLQLEQNIDLLSDSSHIAQIPATSVWIHDAKAPPKLSTMAVCVLSGEPNQQFAWSPDGNSISYVLHGDLFERELTERPATPREQLAAGEHLPCSEMRLLAGQDLDQVGLAAIQYAQDNDEKYPSQQDWQTDLLPYLNGGGNSDALQLGKYPVVFHAPADPALADVPSPMTMVLATMDLPCGHIVVYGDGHVKAYDTLQGAGNQ